MFLAFILLISVAAKVPSVPGNEGVLSAAAYSVIDLTSVPGHGLSPPIVVLPAPRPVECIGLPRTG